LPRKRARRFRGIQDPLPDAGLAGKDGVSRSGSWVNPDDEISLRTPDLERVLHRGPEGAAIAVLGDHENVGVRDLACLPGGGEHDRDAVRDTVSRKKTYRRQPAFAQEPRKLSVESRVPRDQRDRPLSQRGTGR